MFYAHRNVLKQQKIAQFSSVSIGAIFVRKLSFTVTELYLPTFDNMIQLQKLSKKQNKTLQHFQAFH